MKKSKSLKDTENKETSSLFPLLMDEGGFFDLLPTPVIAVDINLKIIKINPAAAGLFGQVIMNAPFLSLFTLKMKDEKLILMNEFLQRKEKLSLEVSFKRDRNLFSFLMTSAALKDKKGIVSGYIIALSDITEQIEDYNNIRTELKEKTILLKEIHHRIKNNLQLINSILTLQMHYGQDDKLTTLLTGLQARIRTIALIHEKLYQTDNPSELNVCYFLKDLKNILIQVYDLNTDMITFNCDIEEIVLETDIVLQLGLITNELITNSIKYAFPNSKGEILISFKNLGNKYELRIKDDGVGISGDSNWKKSETMGSQLLETLTEQLNGITEINTRNGTEYIISFPHN